MSHYTSDNLFSLDGTVAIVTGGAGKGFGAQAVNALAQAGANVVVTSRKLETAQQHVSDLATKGLNATAAQLDLREESSVASLMRTVIKEFGRLDVLVNNACDNHLENFESISLEDWNRVIAVNVTGTMLMVRHAAPLMLNREGGRIINLSSIYGMVSPDQRIYGGSGINSPLVYGVTKAAVLQMTRYLATYYAPHIRVNTITPGGLYNHQDEEFVEGYQARTPLGRMAGKRDLEGAVLYLASAASDYVTGHNLVVDGGWTCW